MKKRILREIKVASMGVGYLLALVAALLMGVSLGKEDFMNFFEALLCYAALWMGARHLRLTLEEERKHEADCDGK